MQQAHPGVALYSCPSPNDNINRGMRGYVASPRCVNLSVSPKMSEVRFGVPWFVANLPSSLTDRTPTTHMCRTRTEYVAIEFFKGKKCAISRHPDIHVQPVCVMRPACKSSFFLWVSTNVLSCFVSLRLKRSPSLLGRLEPSENI